MQGITVALFSEGINFFVTEILTKGSLNQALNSLKPANRTIPYTGGSIAGPSWWDQEHDKHREVYSNISIQLSQGNINDIVPVASSVNLKQQQNGVFQLAFSTEAFKANYHWVETYTDQDQLCDLHFGTWSNNGAPSQKVTPFNYSPGFDSLEVTAQFSFTFSQNAWTLPLTSITAMATNPAANIPSGSILQDEGTTECTTGHVSEATQASVDNIDFKSAIQNSIGLYLTSIPASGQLTPDITFAFGLGDSPLTFPKDQGLTVGVTGISTYKGQPYPGTPPTGLPVPATDQPLPLLFGGIPASEATNFDAKNISDIINDFNTYSPQIPDPNQPNQTVPEYPLTDPTVIVVTPGSEWQVFDSSNNNMFQVQLNTQKNTLDVHGLYHIQMYVSDYTINGLYWAFANAGLLTETVTPAMLQQWGLDPSVLYVSTYYKSIPSTDPLHKALEPYSNSLKKMNALVRPAQGTYEPVIPPRVAFQNVYVFNSNTLTTLQNDTRLVDSTNKNPNWVYDAISGSTITTNAYVDINDLTSDLNDLGIGSPYVQYIASDIQELGALVTHNLELTCTIQDATVPAVNPPPNSPAPYFTFTLTRYDILTDLKLGISKSGKAQTLQFTHTECQPAPTVTMTASNFVPASSFIWLASVWSTVGEFTYSNLLTELGQTGVPLPIMSRFQFLFEEALTNLEQGHIGILANVELIS